MQALHIMDTNLTLLGEITNYTSLRIKRNFRAVGDFELRLPLSHPMAGRIERDMIICPVGWPERAMLVEDIGGEEGKDIATIKGYTLNGIYKRRVCVPPTTGNGYGYDRIIADAETVTRHYIENNVTNPESAVRRIDCVMLEENLHRGMQDVPWSARFEGLDTVLGQIGAYTDSGFDIIPDFSSGKLLARYLEGRDLTGADGVKRVTFSTAMGNVLSATYSESGRKLKNAAVVAGAGEDEDRLIQLYGTAAGLERREEYIDAGSEDDPAELNYKAEHTLAEKVLEQAIKQQVKETPSCRYGVHWDLGDKVRVIARNRKMDARITQIQEAHEANKAPKLTVTFGDPAAGIEKVIADRTRTVAR